MYPLRKTKASKAYSADSTNGSSRRACFPNFAVESFLKSPASKTNAKRLPKNAKAYDHLRNKRF
jgi:hypothetical protein